MEGWGGKRLTHAWSAVAVWRLQAAELSLHLVWATCTCLSAVGSLEWLAGVEFAAGLRGPAAPRAHRRMGQAGRLSRAALFPRGIATPSSSSAAA